MLEKGQSRHQMAKRSYEAPSPPEVVAEAVLSAIKADNPRLRYAVGAGHEVIARRAGVTDEALLAMAGMDDDGYYAGLREKMGMDLT